MLNLSLKQTIITIIFIATLLVALVGGIIRVEAARTAPALPHTTTHTLAWYCPPPPVIC